jgi:Membrane domain of glycerophosphoryl diester phosphodiesterase
MGVGELLDAIFSLYRRNFLLIAAISAVVQVPYAVLQFVLFQVAGFTSFASGPFGRFATPQANQTLTPDQLQALQNAVAGVLVAVGILALVGAFVILPLAEAATTRAVSDRYLDRETSLGTSYGAAIRRLGALIVQSLILLGGAIALFAGAFFILFGFAAGAGGAGAIVGGLIDLGIVGFAIFVYVRTSLAAPAIVLEGVSGWGGLKRSWQLTRGLGWRLLGIRLLLLLITGIISGVFSTLLTLAGAGLDANGQFIVGEVAGAVVAVFVSPITYIAVTLLYYDTRIRKEGFDIEMLARSL